MSPSSSNLLVPGEVNKQKVAINLDGQKSKKARSLRIGKLIEQVLNQSVGSIVKEGPMLIDWDNAATLETISEPITFWTRTPMFIATAISDGRFPDVGEEAKYVRVDSFPKISEAAKAKYRKAYTKERYEFYINAFGRHQKAKKNCALRASTSS
ncbi:hypothetical protein EW145_g6882 [Phellinidium pouzarii]|uniref:Uncharacterized protein n=1 Tax=Phellinidium pouzarii TaxID=167371 RepID=A0A4S4KTC8_9AGAM|nr:hypothetical protein EW145_g6882 [Phellinidium pouzarii]